MAIAMWPHSEAIIVPVWIFQIKAESLPSSFCPLLINRIYSTGVDVWSVTLFQAPFDFVMFFPPVKELHYGISNLYQQGKMMLIISSPLKRIIFNNILVICQIPFRTDFLCLFSVSLIVIWSRLLIFLFGSLLFSFI